MLGKPENQFSLTRPASSTCGRAKGNSLSVNNRRLIQISLLGGWFLLLPFIVQAQFTYTTNNGAITITAYAGSGGAVTIPTTITGLPVIAVGYRAFYNVTNVTAIVIPDSLTSIGTRAFDGCENLAIVTIGNGVVNIGDNPFANCDKLTSIKVGPTNPAYSSVGGVLFDKWQTTLIKFPSSLDEGGTYVIPNTVTNIGDYAFGDSALFTVTIPDSVVTISDNAFLDSSLQGGLLIPNSVTTIGRYAFGWSALAGVIIGNSVTNIGEYAFYSCPLTSVTIPSSVTGIAGLAFGDCTALAFVCFQGNAPAGRGIFDQDAALTNIYRVNGTAGWGATYDGIPTSTCSQCDGLGAPSTVRVLVFDKCNNREITGATITVGSYSTNSDASGQAFISNVPENTYVVTVSQTDYVSTQEVLAVPVGPRTVWATFWLQPLGECGPPISVTLQPTNSSVSVPAGNNITISASVSGAGPFSYQWQLDGTNLPNSAIITTVAGNGVNGYSGDGGVATNASLNYPAGVAVDGSGNLFIADYYNNRIRRMSPTGIITTVAGYGGGWYSGDGGAATNAALYFPSSVSVDGSGNLFIADSGNNRVRKVSADGIISTVAGNGTVGFSGDGGAATNAALHFPCRVSVDGSGNLFFADIDNNRIRKVSAEGIINTVAGNGTVGFSGDGGAATNAALSFPCGVSVDGSDNLFIADGGNHRVRKVSTSGIIATVAGNGTVGFAGDGGAATDAALYSPSGVSVDGAGNIFIADSGDSRIRKVTTNGIITTVAGSRTGGYSGDGGAATDAALYSPSGVSVDGAGNIFIADSGNNRIRKAMAFNPTVLSQTLILNNVGFGNAGAYDVVVSNPYGSITSSVVNVSVTLPLVALSAPQMTVGKTHFAFLLSGPAGSNYVLQVSTNLLNWSSVSTLSMPVSGSVNVSNVVSDYNCRFYRVYLQ